MNTFIRFLNWGQGLFTVEARVVRKTRAKAYSGKKRAIAKRK